MKQVTVAQLIAILQTMTQDKNVIITWDDGYGSCALLEDYIVEKDDAVILG